MKGLLAAIEEFTHETLLASPMSYHYSTFKFQNEAYSISNVKEGEGDGEGEPMDEDAAEILDQQTQPSDKPRITTRYMTKYERARILGTRALQIR